MKRLLVLLNLFVLIFVSGCIWIGLSSSEIKKYTACILEQLPQYSFSNYECDFYYIPGTDTTMQFTSIGGEIEYLSKESSVMLYYNDGTKEYAYDIKKKEETILDKNISSYSTYPDLLDLISFLQAFDGKVKKSTGRRGVEEDEDGIMDEVTYYYYDLNWKYSKGAELNFYISKKTNQIKKILLLDRSNDEGKECPHFRFTSTLKEDVFNLKEEYTYLKEQANQETEEDSTNHGTEV